MSRSSVYCEECGAKLTLFVVGVCPRCEYDLTGRDESRPVPLEATVSDPERTEA